MQKLFLSGVSKAYNDVIALKPVSLEVASGEFLTLLGPSGSGKTTLLQIVAGLLAPDTGEILIDGVTATKLPPHKRDIGLVFQNYALFPHLTVAENIAFPLKMRKRPAAEIAERVTRILDIVRLPQVADRLPKELSGGQQQRIALARCAVYEPSVILMDEPLGALDKKLRDQMQAEIRRLHSELGATIIYVTHDQEEAMAMSDRICLMRAGGIEQLGTPQDLYFRPTTAFAAQFFGSPNLMAGTIAGLTATHADIELNGKLVRVPNPEARAQQGQSVTLMVRPEALRVLADGETAGNVIEADCESSIVTGSVTQTWLRGPGGQPLQALELTARSAPGHVAGARVRLGWTVDEGYLLPAEAAHAQ
ncbi:MAG TPA: ABC transporter ATP-binding protein [Devosia sp.]|nr:ABC transporter ATP-binding protein [Devosia sp.]